MARTLRTPPTAHAPSSMACRPIMLESRVVRCGMVSKPCASRAPARTMASIPTRASVPLLMSMESTWPEAITRPVCSTMRSTVTPLGGSISTETTNFSAWIFSAVFIEMNFLHRFGNGVDVFRSSSAAAADESCAQFRSFLGEEREIFGRGARVHDAIADTLWKTCVGHDAERQGGAGSEFARHGKQKLRADGAVRADGLNIFIFQFFPRVLRASAAEGGAFVGVGHLRDDGQAREGANRVDGGEQFFHVAESFQHEEIHATLFERSGLLLEDGENFFGGKFPNVLDDSERPNGAGNQNFVLGGFARFAGNFYSAMIQFGDAVSHTEEAELVAVGAESIGLDDLGAGFEVALVDVEDGVGCERVELVHAALRADGFVKQRTHGAVNDQDCVEKALVEGFNLHRATVGLEFCMVVNRRVYHREANAPTPAGGNRLWPRESCEISRKMDLQSLTLGRAAT